MPQVLGGSTWGSHIKKSVPESELSLNLSPELLNHKELENAEYDSE